MRVLQRRLTSNSIGRQRWTNGRSGCSRVAPDTSFVWTRCITTMITESPVLVRERMGC